MRRTRSTSSIYDYARGDGWILPHLDVHTGETAFGDPMHTVVLFYTADQRIEEHETSSVDTLLSQLLDVGAKRGSYPGANPEVGVEYADQPRAVRMQRHAPEIFDALGHVEGMSPTIAVRAAEEFGRAWDEKIMPSTWQDRVGSVGEGRAERIAAGVEG